jgi:exonuclease VII large subunit
VQGLAEELRELVPDETLARAYAHVRAQARGLSVLDEVAAVLEADPGAGRTALALALLGGELAGEVP